METKIRHFRKLRGWTLQDLAERIGTTPQTIQRLETSNMTVSTDWLERIGEALDVPPIGLLGGQASREVPLIGSLGEHGIMREPGGLGDQAMIQLEVPAEHPIAVRLSETTGAYPAGTILIANKLTGADMMGALGREAVVQIHSGPVVLRRVVKGADDTFTLVPLGSSGDVRYDAAVDWIARIVMRVEYF